MANKLLLVNGKQEQAEMLMTGHGYDVDFSIMGESFYTIIKNNKKYVRVDYDASHGFYVHVNSKSIAGDDVRDFTREAMQAETLFEQLKRLLGDDSYDN